MDGIGERREGDWVGGKDRTEVSIGGKLEVSIAGVWRDKGRN